MKIFLSWSGLRSNALAKALREWLKSVIVTVDPWMSEEDIEKGQRWSTEIAKQLSTCKFGIICVTRENVGKPWLNFEAGAISKTVSDVSVCPLLLDLGTEDVVGPLAQFQLTSVAKEDIGQLLKTINNALAAAGEPAFPDAQLTKAFERAWPEMEDAIREIPAVGMPPAPQRSDREILSEILDTVRQLARTSTMPVSEGFAAAIAARIAADPAAWSGGGAAGVGHSPMADAMRRTRPVQDTARAGVLRAGQRIGDQGAQPADPRPDVPAKPD